MRLARRTKSFARLAPVLLAACLAAACDRAPPGTVLAQVNGAQITAGDLDAAIAAMPPADRLEYASPEMTRDLLEALVDRKLMAAAARADLPAASSTGDEQALARAWLEAALARVPAPTEQDVAAWYREHGDQFRIPARVLVTRATAPSEAVAGQLRDELARGVTAQGLQARPGGAVLSASQLWLQDVQKNPEATAIALTLRPGEVSRVIPVPGGFMIMRADQVEPPRQRSLAEVRTSISARLTEARQQAAAVILRDGLRKTARISVDEAALASFRPQSRPHPDAR